MNLQLLKSNDPTRINVFNTMASKKIKNPYLEYQNSWNNEEMYEDILDKIPIEEIEKYLRKKKLQKIKNKM